MILCLLQCDELSELILEQLRNICVALNYSPPRCSYFVEEPDQYFALAILLLSQMDQNQRVGCPLCTSMKTEGLWYKKKMFGMICNYSGAAVAQQVEQVN